MTEGGGGWQSERLRQVLDQLTDAVVAVDREFRFVYANAVALRMVGKRLEEIVGLNHWDLLPSLRGTVVWDEYHRALETGVPARFEYRSPLHGRWLEARAFPSEDGMVFHLSDVTDRKQADDERSRRESLVRTMIDAMPQIAWAAELDGRATYFNARWYAYTGLTPDDAYVSREVIHADDLDRILTARAVAYAAGTTYEARLRIRRADGEYRWHLARAEPIRGDDGAPVGYVGTSTDVHEDRLTTEELERVVAGRTSDLTAAVEALQGFTYHVAHDLRSPLRAIASTSRMVQEDFHAILPPEAHELLERQAGAAGKLGQLIDDLLRLSRLSGEEIARTPLDLTLLAESAAADALRLHPDTSARVEVAPGLVADADPRLLGLALGNLVENAVKYSPAGGTVRVGRREDGAYFVSDEGIGIDPAYFERIFEPFQRLHRDEEFEGTGIGLSNVRQIVLRHGGRVWVESAPGQGSTFLFTLG